MFAAMLGLAAALRAGVVVNRGLDPDESQHLHAAWLVHAGRVPFRDFWEHHAPLLYYILAPLTGAFSDRPAVYPVGRLVMTLAAAVALFLVFRLARRVSAPVAMAAVVILAVMPRFAENTTEIRPDVPALVLWLFAVLAVVRWREGGAGGWVWLAGAAQGVGLALTVKAVYGAIALVLVLLLPVDRAAGREPRDLRGIVAPAVSFVLAMGSVLLVGLAALVAHGGTTVLFALADQVVRQNLQFADFMKALPLTRDAVGVGLLATAGLASVTRRQGRSVLGDPLHGTLLVGGGAVTGFLLFPRTPAVYQHAWLPVVPVIAFYAGIGLNGLVLGARARPAAGPRVLLALALLGGLGVPLGEALHEALRDRTSTQLRTVRLLLAATCPGEPILDGMALAVFRPSAQRYGVLTTGVREWIARGVEAEERIEEDFRRARARIAHPDHRLRGLVGPVETFLAEHYVQADDGLLDAGARVPVPGGPQGGRAYVELVAPGPYRLTASPGVEVAIDRAPRRPGWVDLDPGRHELTWVGSPGTIELRAARCAERRVLRARS